LTIESDARAEQASPSPRGDAGPLAPSAPVEAPAKPARTPPHPPLPGRTSMAPEAEPSPDVAEFYLNRELTWLNFAWRVVHEAVDERTPLLERVRFLGIVGSTLDEFFMKRIGGLKQQVGAQIHDLTVDGRTPHDQINACYAELRSLERYMHRAWHTLSAALSEHEIGIVEYASLRKKEEAELRAYYCENIFPLVTPQAMDPAHPFPFISNLSLNLLVTLHYPNDSMPLMARVKVPVGKGIPRFLQVGSTGRFVALEDVMAHNLDLLFPGMVIDTCTRFRVTRNAHTEGDEEEADDLLSLIESELRERKFAPIVRLQVEPSMPAPQRGLLASKFGLDETADVFEVEGLLGKADLIELAALDRADLKDPPHRPVDHPELIDADRNIFHQIRESESMLVYHPYESFSTSVERFLREAAADPKVRAIKMTLYRTSADTNVVDHLIDAARNGKQVAVVVELKARFDEMANIRWANRLEEAGIHVSYGVVGLKTHCKAVLVVRQDYNRLRRYTHLGTGNYHAGNARAYTDLGLLTCDDDIGADMTELFNYLTTGYRPGRKYKKILPAPKLLKPALLSKIEREIESHAKLGNGLIQMKCNAIEDADIIRALYRAAQAGVKVDLIVRDTCRIRPGIAGLSETVRVISIVGRFLEHARIYYFRNGGDEEYYIGSADIMARNLESRVETVVPVEAPQLRRELRYILKTQLADQRSAWEMQPDGSYVQRVGKDEGCQQKFIDWADARHRDATRLKRRRPRGIAGVVPRD
jgi:polyphosphate kinase